MKKRFGWLTAPVEKYRSRSRSRSRGRSQAPSPTHPSRPEDGNNPNSDRPHTSPIGPMGGSGVGPTSGLLIPVPAPDGEPSLWEAAFNGLSERDRAAFPSPGGNTHGHLEAVLEATKRSQEICGREKWRFKVGGKMINLRDRAEKILEWLEKFKQVGDIAVQYDPVHAALPWAGIRFILQVALNDKEKMGTSLIGFEEITRLLARCRVYEEFYLKPASKPMNHASLKEALVKLYGAVLKFLVVVKEYFDQSRTSFTLSTILDPDGGSSELAAVRGCESSFEKEVATAERDSRRLNDERTKKLEDILRNLEAPIIRLDSKMAKLCQQVEENKRREILLWLSRIEYVKHHDNNKEGLLEDTGKWLLTGEKFRDWQNSTTSSFLWLRGDPGVGKTKLTCMVIEQMKPPTDGSQDNCVAFFYCHRNEKNRRDPRVILASVVKQLSVPFLPNLPESVIKIYDRRERDGFASGCLELPESQDVIVSLLRGYSKATIIIDALDEVSPEKREKLLDALKSIINSSPKVKIFVSSRNDVDIRLQLEQLPYHYVDATDNQGDIERFVRREIEQGIKRKKLLHGRLDLDDDLPQDIIRTLVTKANGMFMWVDLQIKYLFTLKTTDVMKEKLGKLPRTLGETYSEIYEKILREDSEELEIAKKALMWLMYSRRPLSSQEWVNVSYWPKLVDPDTGIDSLLKLCHNLVAVDKQSQVVRFAHLSVQEYLENLEDFTTGKAHSMAARFCLGVLLSNEASIPLLLGTAFDYVVGYWMLHASRCTGSQDVLDLLRNFLGTPAEPGRAYSNWYHIATEDGLTTTRFHPSNRGFDHLRASLISLRSKPLNPVFAFCYYHLGTRFQDFWEWGTFDINVRNDIGESLLHIATLEGNEWIVKSLLENGADVNILSKNSSILGEHTPLEGAISRSRVRIAVMLLDYGAGVSHLRKKPLMNSLEYAAKRGDENIVKAIINRDCNIEITERVLVAAAGNKDHAGKILEMLFVRDSTIKITGAVLSAAVENWNGKALEILLDRDPTIQITEAVLSAVARSSSGEALKMLLARDATIQITEPILLAAAKGSNGEALEMLLAWDSSIRITEALLTATAKKSNKKVLEMLLARDPTILITEAVFLGAIKNRESGKEVLEALLTRDPSIQITKAVLSRAILRISDDNPEALDVLLARKPSIQITEAILLSVARRSSGQVLEMLVTRHPTIQITEAILSAAAKNWNTEILEMALERDPTIQITEAVLSSAATNESRCKEALEILLARDPTIQITEATLLSAARNEARGKEALDILLARDPTIQITETVLSAAAQSGDSRTLKMLLARGPTIQITDAILLGAVRNPFIDQETLEILLADPTLQITEAVLLAAATRYSAMKILLARDPTIQTTEAILLRAAAMWLRGSDLEILLARDPTIQITEAVLSAAAGNINVGGEFLEVLLAKGSTIQITEDVLLAAVKNYRRGTEPLEVLLARDPSIEITEAVLSAAARYGRGKVLEMLLTRDPTIKITEAILSAAVDNSKTKSLGLLLARDLTIQITEAILLGAAENNTIGGNALEMLLSRDTNIQITEAILSMAAENHRAKPLEVLLARDPTIQITESLLLWAAGNLFRGKEALETLLAWSPNTQITEAVLSAAVASSNTEALMMLLARDPAIRITEAVLSTAAENDTIASESLTMLLARDTNIEITEAILTAAAGNYKHSVMEVLTRNTGNTNIMVNPTALKASAYFASSTLFNKLLAKCNISSIFPEKYPQFVYAAVQGGNRNILRTLLELGGECVEADEHGWTIQMVKRQSGFVNEALPSVESDYADHESDAQKKPEAGIEHCAQNQPSQPTAWDNSRLPECIELRGDGSSMLCLGKCPIQSIPQLWY